MSDLLALGSLSVVIPVRDDPLLFRCLASVDEKVEVVVVTNGSSPDYRQSVVEVTDPPITVVSLAEAGIGGAYNAGITAASGKYILLMDSDCVFRPGTILALATAVEKADFAKGRVVFSSHNWETRLTAEAREHLEDPLRTGKVNAYSPPLLYRKTVVDCMGGYHFDPRLQWREDRDFELRRRRSGVAVQFVESAVIVHKPLTVREDLRSVMSYGQAQRLGERLGILPSTSIAHEVWKLSRLMARIFSATRDPILAAYPMLRCVAFSAGYRNPASD